MQHCIYPICIANTPLLEQPIHGHIMLHDHEGRDSKYSCKSIRGTFYRYRYTSQCAHLRSAPSSMPTSWESIAIRVGPDRPDRHIVGRSNTPPPPPTKWEPQTLKLSPGQGPIVITRYNSKLGRGVAEKKRWCLPFG